MKIKFVGYWNTDKNIYNIINDIWNYNGDYDSILTHEQNYTHLVVLNSVRFNFNKHNTYGIIVEPHWSTNFDRNLASKCNTVITYQPDKYSEYDNLFFSPLIGTHRLYDCQYHGEIIYKENTTKSILNSTFNKHKKLSIILNKHSNKNNTETLYYEREQLLNKLLDSDIDFDMFGQDWNISDPRYKGFLSNKIDGIKDYEYTISLENSNIRGNITEKIIDPILCNTIPIYNGHKSIEEFYPNCCEYLDYDGFEIDKIKEIINSDKTFKDYSFEKAKDTYLNVYNPIKIIKKIIEQNENYI